MKVFLKLSILFLIFQTTYAQNSDIFYKLKINYSNGEDLIELANNGVCIDHGLNKKNHFFISDFSASDLDKIKSLGFTYEILIEDVTSFYQNRNKSELKLKSNEYCIDENNDYITPNNYDIKTAMILEDFIPMKRC